MRAAAQSQSESLAPVETYADDAHDLCHIPLRSDGAVRSARNIARWQTFLPTECVRLMVMMGWDYTT